MPETPSKSVTLYLSEDTIAKMNAFANATLRSKSMAAEVLLLHGIANYDVIAAAPQKVKDAKQATKVNTRVKKRPAVKGVRKKTGPKPKAGVTAPKRRGRPPKAASAAKLKAV